MLIVQLSDLHVLRKPDPRQPMLASNADRLERAVQFIRELNPQPDIAVVTGDISHDADASDYAFCRDILSRLPCSYFVIPGNHDDRSLVRATFPLDGMHADETFYQFECDTHGLRVIGLDTLENGIVGGELCPARLAWCERALARSQKPALLIMHHPPYQFGAVENPDMACTRGADTLAALVRSNGKVAAAVCGHLHLGTMVAWAGTQALTAPSIAPGFALEIATSGLAGWQDTPPGFALHLWRGNGELVTHFVHIGGRNPYTSLPS